MSVPARITAFAVGLALIFTAATVAGGAVDPDVADEPGPHDMASEGSTEEMTSMTEQPPGLASSHDGYRFAPAATTARSADRVRYEFTILGPGGEPVTAFDVEHERRMHLIAVRRDFAGFQHAVAGAYG